MGLAVLVAVDSSVAGDGAKAVAVLCRCCAGRFLLGRLPVHPGDVADTCGCDESVVDAGPGQSRVLDSSMAHGSTPSVALTAPQGFRARFAGRLVIVTGATVSTLLLVYTAGGQWTRMWLCRSSMKRLRPSASPYCPGVDSV